MTKTVLRPKRNRPRLYIVPAVKSSLFKISDQVAMDVGIKIKNQFNTKFLNLNIFSSIIWMQLRYYRDDALLQAIGWNSMAFASSFGKIVTGSQAGAQMIFVQVL